MSPSTLLDIIKRRRMIILDVYSVIPEMKDRKAVYVVRLLRRKEHRTPL